MCVCILCCLQELGKFLVRASNLLADLHQLLIPVTVRRLPPGRAASKHSRYTLTAAVSVWEAAV